MIRLVAAQEIHFAGVGAEGRTNLGNESQVSEQGERDEVQKAGDAIRSSGKKLCHCMPLFAQPVEVSLHAGEFPGLVGVGVDVARPRDTGPRWRYPPRERNRLRPHGRMGDGAYRRLAGSEPARQPILNCSNSSNGSLFYRRAA